MILLEIVDLNIPTGLPLVYEFDNEANPVNHFYLANDIELKEKLRKYEENRMGKFN